MFDRLLEKFLHWKPIALLLALSKRLVLPGFSGLPVYNVATFFIKGILKGRITTRASSLSFTFFLALFPAVIFFFTIIPYIPIAHFQDTLLGLLKEVIPAGAYESVNATLIDIVKRQHGGLLSFGFLMTVYLATNGIQGIIREFNSTYHTIETRSAFKQRLISLFLVGIISLLIIGAIVLITISTFSVNFLKDQGIIESNFTYHLIRTGRWFIMLIMLFIAISCIYYLAPADKSRFRFISAGSTLATFLSLVISLGFNFYISHFAQYNILYGSIGTLIIVMLMIYFNAIILLVGFELNASIYNAKIKTTNDDN